MRLTSCGFAVALALTAACDAGPGTIGISTTGSGSSVATHLSFTTQPAQTQVHGALLVPALQVSALSLTGATDTTFAGTISISLGTSPSGATIGGNPQIAATRGIATFNNLTVSSIGAYTLVASGSNVTSATSTSFNAQ
ncbi:MAG TPA: hypothetical protein VLT79_11245 [Gemmatimonadales bacterium]|nr:hypothetical protein [Gemmatimonadales bacterium]